MQKEAGIDPYFSWNKMLNFEIFLFTTEVEARRRKGSSWRLQYFPFNLGGDGSKKDFQWTMTDGCVILKSQDLSLILHCYDWVYTVKIGTEQHNE